jgi:Single Cache domain 2
MSANMSITGTMEEVMLRNLALVVGYAVVLVLLTVTSVPSAQFGTEEEAKAMLEKAVAAVKKDKAKALDMFNKGEGGFKDRDLYVFCANTSDGVLTAHPYLKGEHLQDIKGKKGFPLGQEIMRTATEGKINEVTYWWPRPGSTKPLEKHTSFTRVGDQDSELATTRNERRSLNTR